jgi:5-hydroxyisourate hydrolase
MTMKMKKSPITTHVLDTSRGKPACQVKTILYRVDGDRTGVLGSGFTNDDGRVLDLLPDGARLEKGTYRLVFDVASYFASRNEGTFYPTVTIDFRVADPSEHHHVPLLLTPFGYTTYRGS